MRTATVITPILLLGTLVLAGETPDATESAAKPSITNLMTVPLADEFTPDREVLVDLVELPPHAVLERHWHPGEEFHYYLEGEIEIRFDGEPPLIGRPGTIGHIPFRKWHQAVAGADGARALVFRVHTEGEPWRYLEEKSQAAGQ
jgi:quercetin dioxygenase-like cupin family protein